MKVYIGPYTKYISTDRLACAVLFWLDQDHPAVDGLADWLDRQTNNTIARLVSWVQTRTGKRKVKIEIHEYDIWNADNTMALVILPILKKIQETLHSSHATDDIDVPAELRRPANASLYDCDAHWEARWNWVLGEMIFAFESKFNDWDQEFYAEDESGTFDKIGYDQYQARITNGFRLFGKYYEALWT